MFKIKHSVIFLLFFGCEAQNKKDVVEIVFNLPRLLSETSGLETLSARNGFWTINDSGNSNELYLINAKGNIEEAISITNARNKDWEALASDGINTIYIGDFGNNNNLRRNLAIYHVNTDAIKESKVQAIKTTFVYEDQKKFPPKKKDRNFDAEAFFYYNNYFYVFSKNRSTKFDGTTKLYKILAEEGEQIAKLVGRFKTCDKVKKCLVTGADISADGKQVALTTHDKVFLFANYNGDNFFDGTQKRIELYHNSQKEAICFFENELYITDERASSKGGNLYRLNTRTKNED